MVPTASRRPLGQVILSDRTAHRQSATGHGITFHAPLMIQAVAVNDRMKGIAVDGRPADCVKLAIAALWPERFGHGSSPDLVITGMNSGANVGINVIYSGTVAAAIEAAFLGVPSIAVSLHLGKGANGGGGKPTSRSPRGTHAGRSSASSPVSPATRGARQVRPPRAALLPQHQHPHHRRPRRGVPQARRLPAPRLPHEHARP